MTQELWYTSAPRGLKPGSRGFCTVVSTPGMPVNLAERLESLSGYRHLEPPKADRSDTNPVAWNHVRLGLGGRRLHICSRIGSFGLDYSGRSNKFAHHVVLEPQELPPAGPAWLLQQPGFLETQWDGQPRVLPAGRKVPEGSAAQAAAGPCLGWQEWAGDAGWAGVLAETVLEPPAKSGRVVYLVVPPEADVLALLAEAVALLPPERRWHATFSTFYLPMPGDVECRWRAVIEGTPEAAAARRHRGAMCLNLTEKRPAPDTAAAQAARQGKCLLPQETQATSPPPLATPAAEASAKSGVECTEAPIYGPSPPPIIRVPPLPPRRVPGHPRCDVMLRRKRWPRRIIAAIAIALAAALLLAALVRWPAGRQRIVTLIDAVRQRLSPTEQGHESAKNPPKTEEKTEPKGQPESTGGRAAPEQKPQNLSGRNTPPASPATNPAETATQPPPDGTQATPPNRVQAAPKTPPALTNPQSPAPTPQPLGEQQPHGLWCELAKEHLPKPHSQAAGAGTSASSKAILIQVEREHHLTGFKLRPVCEIEPLQAQGRDANAKTWTISTKKGSAVLSPTRVATMELRSDGKLELTLEPGQDPYSSLVGHIAVLELSKGGEPTRKALQFFEPRPYGPLNLEPGRSLQIPLPDDLANLKGAAPPVSPPLVDLALSDISIKSSPAASVRSFTPCPPRFGATAGKETVYEKETVYKMEVVGSPQGGGSNDPPAGTCDVGLKWLAGKISIHFTPSPPIKIEAITIKKGRIYVGVPAPEHGVIYCVTLVEIGAEHAEPAAKRTHNSKGQKKQDRKSK